LFDWRADQFGSYYGKEGNVRWRLVLAPAAGGAPQFRNLTDAGGGTVKVQRVDAHRVAIKGGRAPGVYWFSLGQNR
jgi:hypothetical protein